MPARRKRKNRSTTEDRELFTGIALCSFLAIGCIVLIIAGVLK